MEASSHGLIQRRLDGVEVAAGAFTNLSRDHLDYHRTMEAYMAAKMRLFDTILQPGSAAVVNLDDVYGEAFASAARISGLDLQTVGAAGSRIRVLDVARDGWAQIATVDIGDGPRAVRIPLGRRLPGVECPGRRRPGRRAGGSFPLRRARCPRWHQGRQGAA